MINSGYLEPITEDMIEELKEGEWIWDNELVNRREHRQTLQGKDIQEPYGFRQIHIISITSLIYYTSTKLMLTDHTRGYYIWEYFEEGRFYRFKKKEGEQANDLE